MNLSFENRVALVTGAGSGTGLATAKAFGRLDAAYNNAGVMTPANETADAGGEDFERVMEINLRGVWNCMKYELRQRRRTCLLE